MHGFFGILFAMTYHFSENISQYNASFYDTPGLDPAGPAFESYNNIVRVDVSDADFVDIMHTDAEALLDAGK